MSLETAARATSISVAIVDDEASVRVSLRRLCSAFGLSVTTFASGQEFLESLEGDGHRPDCLLLDAHMPGMTGLELQRHLGARGVRFPTVLFTADDTPEVQARYLSAGVVEYLRKPVNAEELLAAIERAVALERTAGKRPAGS